MGKKQYCPQFSQKALRDEVREAERVDLLVQWRGGLNKDFIYGYEPIKDLGST